jgi:hypothetical protein
MENADKISNLLIQILLLGENHLHTIRDMTENSITFIIYGDHIKKHEMRGVCSTHGRDEKSIQY